MIRHFKKDILEMLKMIFVKDYKKELFKDLYLPKHIKNYSYVKLANECVEDFAIIANVVK